MLVKTFYKGRSLLLLPFFVSLLSCASDSTKYGKVTLHSTSNKDSFIFSVSDEFAANSLDSKVDKNNSNITLAESKLLQAILKQKKYCLDQFGAASFKITSRQEKIYDMTFAHLIEQNYKARSVTPRMYYGECLRK